MFEHYPLRFMFAFGASLAAALGFGIAWFRVSRRLRELEDRVLPPHTPATADTDRSDAVLDGLVARVEDLASGQDFLNRVLSERLARPSSRARETTPV